MSTKQYRKLIKQAEVDYAAGNFLEAESLFEEAFSHRIELDDYISYGFVKLEMDRNYDAEVIFNEVLDEVEHPSAIYGLAVIDAKMGRNDAAIEKYKKLIYLKVEDPIIYKNIADLYDDLGYKDEAIHYYLKSVELNGDRFWPYTNIGAIYEEKNQNELALDYLLKAYQINPNEKIISYNLGVVYGKLKQYDLSIKHYLEDLKKEEPSTLTYYNLALAYKDGFGDLINAKKYYLLGLKENQDNYHIWFNLGCVHALLKDFDAAAQCFIYLKYKAPKFFSYIHSDPELVEFRNTLHYQEIMG